MPEHFDHKMLWPNRAIFEYSDRLLVGQVSDLPISGLR